MTWERAAEMPQKQAQPELALTCAENAIKRIRPRANAGAASLTNRANSFQIVNIPFSSLGRKLLQTRIHGFLARDQFGHGQEHGAERSVHFADGDDGFHHFGQRRHTLAELGHDHRPLTSVCTARLRSINEREHLLSIGNALDDARNGNDFAGKIAGIGGE